MTLKHGQKVIIGSYEYIVERTHLACPNNNNGIVFDELGIEKYTFCTKHYGYQAGSGDWPICYKDDYEALTRVYEALKKHIKTGVESIIESIINDINNKEKIWAPWKK